MLHTELNFKFCVWTFNTIIVFVQLDFVCVQVLCMHNILSSTLPYYVHWSIYHMLSTQILFRNIYQKHISLAVLCFVLQQIHMMSIS